MNIRKPVDYSAMYTGMDQALERNLLQMELYLEIGKLVSARTEKGAAVAAAEYLAVKYPDNSGFSPRNLRRMRDFFRTYETTPDILGSPDWVDAERGYHGGGSVHGSAALVSSSCLAV